MEGELPGTSWGPWKVSFFHQREDSQVKLTNQWKPMDRAWDNIVPYNPKISADWLRPLARFK